jgi:L-fuconolactonase
MKIIDSHHHLWRYAAEEYPWMGDKPSVLKQDYLLPELQAIATKEGIAGFVTVQARQSLEETRWLIELAKKSSLIRGVVGWVPLQEAAQLESCLEELADFKQLKGVRHVVHDEPDDHFILGSRFNQGMQRIHQTGWVYDLLIFAKHLAATIEFVDNHPNQYFVLDHIAKPTIRANQFDNEWERLIRELAKRPHVVCKFSGVVTEVREPQWDLELIRPYWDVMLSAFGSQRIMYGSDWPVCLLRSPYGRWKSTVSELAASLSQHEQAAFWSGNAIQAYKL